MATCLPRTWMLPGLLLEDIEDFVDLKGTVTRCLASPATWSASGWLEAYESAVNELAVVEVEAAFVLGLPGAAAIRAHALALRHIARAQARLVRVLLRLADAQDVGQATASPRGGLPVR